MSSLALRPGDSLTILKDGFVNRLQNGKFPPHPALQATVLGLLPRWDSHPLVHANPNQSYAFFGAAGTSKTTYGVALYENVLWNYVAKYWTDRNGAHQPTIWRKSAKYLLDEFVNFSTSKEVAGKAAKEPSVNRRIIEKAARYGKTPRLFLEEIDKTRYTEFKTAQVFELFDAIYENNGRLVFNSNLTPEEFEKQFFRASDAEALVRRITEAGKVFNFHEEGWTE